MSNAQKNAIRIHRQTRCICGKQDAEEPNRQQCREIGGGIRLDAGAEQGGNEQEGCERGLKNTPEPKGI
ncbi:hypothetical protein [Cognatiyoonia sp. IB215182]|uniref:hypothetical protein n=1 Tax=Cognatiyoonia sp. IB215182 TaxID=3097353 RepID=UPI002A0D15C0|nr:hypothetical protein [Cognatiyoonia sp. IB215182]MDX8354845.1 hypothetical protein [Cognatiyoonia sp. IB215182]